MRKKKKRISAEQLTSLRASLETSKTMREFLTAPKFVCGRGWIVFNKLSDTEHIFDDKNEADNFYEDSV